MGILEYSLIANSILLFCLFAPNIVYLIHKKHFVWRKDKSSNQFIEKHKNTST